MSMRPSRRLRRNRYEWVLVLARFQVSVDHITIHSLLESVASVRAAMQSHLLQKYKKQSMRRTNPLFGIQRETVPISRCRIMADG